MRLELRLRRELQIRSLTSVSECESCPPAYDRVLRSSGRSPPNRATLGPEALMTTSSGHADCVPHSSNWTGVPRQVGARRRWCAVDTDEELDEFLHSTYAARRADLGWPVSLVVLDTDVTSTRLSTATSAR